MLREMRIRNLGVIEDAVLELSPGLNVLTGETGAGKTMVVSGLGLLLGRRADAGLVRAGATAALVEGVLEPPPGHPAWQRATDAGALAEDLADGLIVSRSVGREGRSRSHAGGRSVPSATLADIGERVVAVHGQADQWRLRQADQHRAAVDAAGGRRLASLLEAYRRCYQQERQLSAEADRLSALEHGHELELDLLRQGLAELTRVDPAPGEDQELAIEEERLAHGYALAEAAARAHALLSGDDGAVDALGAVTLLAQARSALATASAHDPALAGLEARCAEAGFLVADLGDELGSYCLDVQTDPGRLAAIQQRRADLAKLTRSRGGSVAAVLSWGAAAAARLAELEAAPQRAGEVAQQLADVRTEAADLAHRLSEERRRVAAALAARLQHELADLAMPHAHIEITVSGRPDPAGLQVPGSDTPLRFGPDGVDDVEIRMSANAGMPTRSLTRAASGGELSRVMLAVELATGGTELPTFVFDEVDAGVGGRAALDLGARLAELSRHAQVIVVTHLAQVAAFADHHLVVAKTTQDQITASDVRTVTGADRVAELARMMGGVSDSEAALAHARDLLERAATVRASPERPSPAGQRDQPGEPDDPVSPAMT